MISPFSVALSTLVRLMFFSSAEEKKLLPTLCLMYLTWQCPHAHDHILHTLHCICVYVVVGCRGSGDMRDRSYEDAEQFNCCQASKGKPHKETLSVELLVGATLISNDAIRLDTYWTETSKICHFVILVYGLYGAKHIDFIFMFYCSNCVCGFFCLPG